MGATARTSNRSCDTHSRWIGPCASCTSPSHPSTRRHDTDTAITTYFYDDIERTFAGDDEDYPERAFELYDALVARGGACVPLAQRVKDVIDSRRGRRR